MPSVIPSTAQPPSYTSQPAKHSLHSAQECAFGNLISLLSLGQMPHGINPKTAPLFPPLLPSRCLLQVWEAAVPLHQLPALHDTTSPRPSPNFQNLSVLLVRPKHFTSDSCLNDKPIVLGFQTRLGWLLHKPLLSLCLFVLQPNPSLCPHCQLQIPSSTRERGGQEFFF